MITKIKDFYFDNPFKIDLAVVILIVLASTFCDIAQVVLSKEYLLNIISSQIDTSVSLSGFALAALTIIVTFKSNLRAKNIEETENALDMILSSQNYNNIVAVFKISIVELVLLFSVLYCVWINSCMISSHAIYVVANSALYIITFSIGRSLLLLFALMSKKMTE